MQHPEDNRNQIRELAQTLMDGGVLDELIQQKLDAFNARWDELMARVRHRTLTHADIYSMHTLRGDCTAVLRPHPYQIIKIELLDNIKMNTNLLIEYEQIKTLKIKYE